MKKVLIYSLIAVLGIVISSCGSSNSVVNNHGISKRKYTKGFFFQRNHHLKTSDEEAKNVDVKEGKTFAKVEKMELRKATKLETKQDKAIAKMEVRLAKKVESKEPMASTNTRNVADERMVKISAPVKEEARQPSSDDLNNSDGLNWSVVENQPSESEESIAPMPHENRDKLNTKKVKDSNGSSDDLMFVLAVVFAILIPPLGVAIYTNIDWIKVLIALLLMILFILPGIIYALLVVFDVI